MAKACSSCGEVKDEREFHLAGGPRGGRTAWCKVCADDPDRSIKRRNTLSKYKLSAQEYVDLLQAQGGRCAICDVSQTEVKRRFAVDHDHACCPGDRSCGRCVRGLLCSNCNTAIGLLQDNPNVLRSAADYLESHRG